jgi:hypothetical protein
MLLEHIIEEERVGTWTSWILSFIIDEDKDGASMSTGSLLYLWETGTRTGDRGQGQGTGDRDGRQGRETGTGKEQGRHPSSNSDSDRWGQDRTIWAPIRTRPRRPHQRDRDGKDGTDEDRATTAL